jgi:hypothetical protein
MPAPHLIVVWDGDKIDKVPIPMPEGHPDEGTLLRLTSDEIVGVVRDFLSSKEYSFPGLSLRIHSRDALIECVVILIAFRISYILSHSQNRPVHPVNSRLHLPRVHAFLQYTPPLRYLSIPVHLSTPASVLRRTRFPRRLTHIANPHHRLRMYPPRRPLLYYDRW